MNTNKIDLIGDNHEFFSLDTPIREDAFKKSNDEKNYLASMKNITGNTLEDKELISATSFDNNKFSKKIKDLYFSKKEIAELRIIVKQF